MIDFYKVVLQTFKTKCNKEYKINVQTQHIIEVAFKKFSIVLFYNKYEYDLGINYIKDNRKYSLERVLLNIGCNEELLPAYRYMSNETIMAGYIEEYISLINTYFHNLNDFEIDK